MYKHPLLDRDKITPVEALQLLVEGNDRFLENFQSDKNFKALIQDTQEKQHPFAAVLSCSDSRVPVEMVFDQALGDIFSVRLAGNIATDKAIGSLEFSTKYLGSRLIVVMGHSSCGAVKAACDDFKDGHIGEIINLIKPAIRRETTVDSGHRASHNPEFVEKINHHNVDYQIETILRHSDIISDLVAEGKVGIIGATYDISTGKVAFKKLQIN